jgi:hypothetical protein
VKLRSKRHILLLEVLVAIAIVVLCIVPLLRPHLFILTEEKRFIREVELDRLVGILYANLLIEGFYHGNIKWDTIANGESIPLDDPAVRDLGFTGSYKFSLEKKKAKVEEDNYILNLIRISYSFDPIGGGTSVVYSYDLFVQRGEPKDKSQEEEQKSNA